MSRPMPVVIKSVAYGTWLVPGPDQKMGLFNAATTSEVERFRLPQKGSLLQRLERPIADIPFPR